VCLQLLASGVPRNPDPAFQNSTRTISQQLLALEHVIDRKFKLRKRGKKESKEDLKTFVSPFQMVANPNKRYETGRSGPSRGAGAFYANALMLLVQTGKAPKPLPPANQCRFMRRPVENRLKSSDGAMTPLRWRRACARIWGVLQLRCAGRGVLARQYWACWGHLPVIYRISQAFRWGFIQGLGGNPRDQTGAIQQLPLYAIH
jgi:hypothetical protein